MNSFIYINVAVAGAGFYYRHFCVIYDGTNQSSAKWKDPVGEILEERDLPNGLHIQKTAVPLGVCGIICQAVFHNLVLQISKNRSNVFSVK